MRRWKCSVRKTSPIQSLIGFTRRAIALRRISATTSCAWPGSARASLICRQTSLDHRARILNSRLQWRNFNLESWTTELKFCPARGITTDAHHVHILSRRATADRLMAYLRAISKEKGSCEFDIPLDRQGLADYLCVERSALSAEISRLSRTGVISAHKRHFFLKT